MTFFNYLGVFDSVSALWASVPEGGAEGDYARIGGSYYGWNKYQRKWVVIENPTGTQEDPRPETPSQPVTPSSPQPSEYESAYPGNVNYLGEYADIASVWTVIPEGGNTGDFVTINGVQYSWDNETRNWVLSADSVTPISVTPPEVDTIGINFLGTFASIDDVWVFYPEGGHDGDYISVDGDVYTWDVIGRNWVENDDPRITVFFLAALPSTNVRINYLGAFNTLGDAWDVYPEGGYIGDYIHLAEEIRLWNIYSRNWLDTPSQTPAVINTVVDGDLTVNHDLYVGGKIFVSELVVDNPAYYTKAETDSRVSEILSSSLSPLTILLGNITLGTYNPLQGASITITKGGLESVLQEWLHKHDNKGVLDNFGTTGTRPTWNGHELAYLSEQSAQVEWFIPQQDGSLRLNPQYTGLWADGFVSSGHASSAGPSPGGVDLSVVWASLKNTDPDTTYNDEQIATAHLTNALLPYATQTYVDYRFQQLIGAAPSALDTLEEIAEALADAGDAVAALTNLVSTKADASALLQTVTVGSTPYYVSGTNVTIPAYPQKLSDLTDDILSGHYLPLSGGTLTGALTVPASSSANERANGLNLGTIGHIGANNYDIGIYSGRQILLCPNGTTDKGITLTSTSFKYNGSEVWTKENLLEYQMPTNSFGGSAKSLHINSINNGFYAMHLRSTVTLTGFSSGTPQNLFDSNYESVCTIPQGGTGVILIDRGAVFATYTYGYLYVSFYYTGIPESVSVRAYGVKSGTKGWHDYNTASYYIGTASSTTNVCIRCYNLSIYNIEQWEITVVAKDSIACKVTQVEHQWNRGSQTMMSAVTKFAIKQDLWGDVEAPKFIKRGGTSSQFLKADGSVDSNTYALASAVVDKTSDQTIGGAKTFSEIVTAPGFYATDSGVKFLVHTTPTQDDDYTLTVSLGGRPTITVPGTLFSKEMAFLAEVVTLAGNQTVTGKKTFNAGLEVAEGQSIKLGDGVLVWDDDNEAWHLQGSFYADGFISSGAGSEDEPQVTSLTSLSDVSIAPASLNDGDLITWNATAGKWVKIAQSSISPDLSAYAQKSWVQAQGYLTAVTSSMITSALGYTPFNNANFTQANIKTTLGISDWALAPNPPATATAISALTDVQLTSLATDDLLLWNGTKWANTAKNTLLSGYVKSSDIKTLTFAAGQFSAGTYNTSGAVTINIPTNLDQIADGSIRKLSDYATSSGLATQTARIDKILSWFDEDANGNIYVVPKNNVNRGFYNNGFISSGEGRSQSSGTADVSWGTTTQDAATLIVDGVSFSLLKESAHNKIVFLTESEYEGLATKEAGVIYMTYESS